MMNNVPVHHMRLCQEILPLVTPYLFGTKYMPQSDLNVVTAMFQHVLHERMDEAAELAGTNVIASDIWEAALIQVEKKHAPAAPGENRAA